jgi:membrane-associated phospholipid phosphatase
MLKNSIALDRMVSFALAAFLLAASAPVLAQTTAVEAAPDISSVPLFPNLWKDTIGDLRKLPTRESLSWLAIGAATSFVGHSSDSSLTRNFSLSRLDQAFGSGKLIGGLPVQLGGAFAAYTVGRLTNSPRTVRVGAELIRAQMMASTVTYAMKYSVRRTRPDGSRFSFPSGHTAVTFSSATVLQKNFGWKAGVPAYAVASYVAASRIQSRRHYLSDIAFGAAVGIMAGRTVTVGHGKRRLAVAPMAAPGGGGIAFTLVGSRQSR